MLEKIKPRLLPGEEVWFVGNCLCLDPPSTVLLLTNGRLLTVQGNDLVYSVAYADVSALVAEGRKNEMTVVESNGNVQEFKAVWKKDHATINSFFQRGRATPPPQQMAATLEADAQENNRARDRAILAKTRADMASERSWPNSQIVGGTLSKKASEATFRLCQGDEDPWLILTSMAGAGVLAAFDDRLAIIKTGALTSLMAGSFGGERSAVFHYRDITGMEYNSGLVNGVLEVLTPSYQGTANKDFWRGSTAGRNSDSNDPYTLSNCLPLTKSEYNAMLDHINDLRARISKAKEVTVNVTTAVGPSQGSTADELKKLADLRDSGILTDEEFAAAKTRLLSG